MRSARDVAQARVAGVVTEPARKLRPARFHAQQLRAQLAAGDLPVRRDQVDLVAHGAERVARAMHGVVTGEQAQEIHPVPDELGVDLSRCCGCGRGAKAEGGPGARAEKAPTAQGIHVFSHFGLGGPA